MPSDINFPFTAISGHKRLKLGLILNAIDPKIGGLLIRGEKGTGKSTAVRSLVDVLPEIDIVENCPFNCDPNIRSLQCQSCRERTDKGEKLPVITHKMRVINLPIGATEDMVVGSLNIERAIREGIKALEPGLLARANRNILYVDEINLLPDHIVDDILDAAASGVNVVEREGVSVIHPASFILVGSMNPEEGELRPQLLDRLALHVEVHGILDEDKRVQIIQRSLEFEKDPQEFINKWNEKQEGLTTKIREARSRLLSINIPEEYYRLVARISVELGVDGHRPDIVIMRAARALAAFMENDIVDARDILTCAELALTHRTRRYGYEAPATIEQITNAFYKAEGKKKER